MDAAEARRVIDDAALNQDPDAAGAARQNVNTNSERRAEKAMSYSKRLETLPLS